MTQDINLVLNNILIILGLTVFIVCLPACNTVKNTQSFTPITSEANQAAIYIYRPLVMANAFYSPDLYINDELKLSVKAGKNTRLTFTPGEYELKLAPDKNYSGVTHLSLNLNAGSTYYIRVDTSLKIVSATSYEPYQRSFNMVKVEDNLAQAQIAKCCLNKNEPETKAIKQKTKDSFSVDKTHNPFSH